MIAITLTHHLAESGIKILAFIIYNLAVNALFNHIAGLGAAVIIKEVIAINTILGLEVDGERTLQIALLVVGKVQHLFGNTASPLLVKTANLNQFLNKRGS